MKRKFANGLDDAPAAKRKTNDSVQNGNGNFTDVIEDSDEELIAASEFFRKPKAPKDSGTSCPYLDQINRKALDFDFEKVCSATMTNHNVYGCLVCGHYFAGRAKGSPAYFHALHENHRVFIHLGDSRIYCLPDDYEVIDTSLDDIRHNLHPSFTEKEISLLDTNTEYSHALDGNDYLPGVIGLNDLSGTDWVNCCIQSLMRVPPLRNYFIKPSNYSHIDSEIVDGFGELVRKYFNPRNFKGHVSPHEFMQTVSHASQKKFQIGQVSDPFNFISWILNKLHEEMGGTKQRESTIISKIFQGQVREEIKIPIGSNEEGEELYELKTKNRVFLYLNLKLPPMPLFKDGQQEKFIPQIPLPKLLMKKFGDDEEVEWEPLKNGSFKRHVLTRLPSYLCICYKRFHENNFYIEKNNTIVNFVVKNLDLRQYAEQRISTEYLSTMPITKLKTTLKKFGGTPSRYKEKVTLMRAVADASENRMIRGKYDLVANVCHLGKFLKGVNHVYVLNRPNNQWYKIDNLHVQEVIPHLVSVSEAYFQFWERT